MKTKNIFTCAMLALATISCNDLDVDIKSQYTEYPIDSDIALEARISNAYYAFRTPLARRYDELLSLSSDVSIPTVPLIHGRLRQTIAS